MAISSAQFTHSTIPVFPFSSRNALSRTRISCSSSALTSMESGALTKKFREFPYVSVPLRNLMLKLISSMEARIGDSLQPCTLPPDAQYFKNSDGSAHASLHLRSGVSSSQVESTQGPHPTSRLP